MPRQGLHQPVSQGHNGIVFPPTRGCTPKWAVRGGPLDVSGLPLQRFHTVFPDSKGWINRLAPRSDKTVKGLLADMEYEGDPNVVQHVRLPVRGARFAERGDHRPCRQGRHHAAGSSQVPQRARAVPTPHGVGGTGVGAQR